MKLRLGNAADIPAMIELERRCKTATHWSEAQYRAAVAGGANASPSRLVLIAEDEPDSLAEGRSQDKPTQDKPPLIAFLVARHIGVEWELENIVVDPTSRRKGVGTHLLAELLKRAKASGSESVHLEVRESNEGARAFYEKCDFEQAGRRKRYYADPVEDALIYSLRLSQTGSQNDTEVP